MKPDCLFYKKMPKRNVCFRKVSALGVSALVLIWIYLEIMCKCMSPFEMSVLNIFLNFRKIPI